MAHLSLGARYGNGEGVPKDDLEAYKWLLLAGAQGNEIAKKNLSIVERKLTGSQRAEGQKLARKFKSRLATAEGGMRHVPV